MRREVCKLNRCNCVSAVTWYFRDLCLVFLLLPPLSLFLFRLVWGWRLLVSVSWGKCSSVLRDPKQINMHYNLITSPPQHTHNSRSSLWSEPASLCVSPLSPSPSSQLLSSISIRFIVEMDSISHDASYAVIKSKVVSCLRLRRFNQFRCCQDNATSRQKIKSKCNAF